MKLREIRDELAHLISVERGARLVCGEKNSIEAMHLGKFFAEHAWVLGEMCIMNPQWGEMIAAQEGTLEEYRKHEAARLAKGKEGA